MNSFREKLISFLSYMSDYKLINTVIATILAIGLLWIAVPSKALMILFLFLMLFIPIMFVHIVEPKENRLALSFDKNLKPIKNIMLNVRSIFKHYIIKYLKSYALFLIILMLTIVFTYGSIILSLAMILYPLEKSFGQSIVLFLSPFVLIEGFTFIMSLPVNAVLVEVKSINPFKSLFFSRPFCRKQLLRHIISSVVFAIFCLPIVMLSDVLSDIVYLSTVLRMIYILIVINYIVFDAKTRIEKFDFTKKPRKKFWKNK